MSTASPLRVALLHITPPSFMGGYERFAARLVGDLAQAGIVAEQVAVPNRLSRLAYMLTAGSAKHVPRQPDRDTSWIRARRRLLLADCIYVKNDPLDLAVARVLTPDKPMVVGIHSSLDIPNAGWRTWLRRSARQSSLYRTLLVGNRRLYHCLYPPPSRWGLPPSRVRVVPHPINPELTPTRSPSQVQRFLFVGRLNPDKGADLLCGLADTLAREHDTELVVVGQGEYESVVRHHPGIRYHPYRSDVRNLMRQATWLLMPSRWEQQPLVLIESIEEGLPYIIGPAPEIERFGLDDRLIMRTATVASLHACCLAAIQVGRVNTEYLRIVDRVREIAVGWPSPDETRHALVTMLTEAARL